MPIKVWHCHNARSLRALWALEEMGLDYEVEVMAFPPRFTTPDFLNTNELGTIPYMIDGDVHMTESSGIPLYLVEKYGKHEVGLRSDHPESGEYLNWLCGNRLCEVVSRAFKTPEPLPSRRSRVPCGQPLHYR